jgi:hypothetical protein
MGEEHRCVGGGALAPDGARRQTLAGGLCVVRPGQAPHHPCNSSASPCPGPAAPPCPDSAAPPCTDSMSGRRQTRQAYGGHLQRRACPANKVVT